MSGTATPEAYAELHKRAFRITFDYLNAHFPPGGSSEWWEKAAADIVEVMPENGNELLDYLLPATFDYLDHECKKREEQTCKP